MVNAVSGPPPAAIAEGTTQLNTTFFKYQGEVVEEALRNFTNTVEFDEYVERSTVQAVVEPDVVFE